MKDTTKTIAIYAREVKTGRTKFYAFSTKIKDAWYKVKFTRNCNLAVNAQGTYYLTFKVADSSISKNGNYIDKNGEVKKENDTIWIRNIVDIVSESNEEKDNKNYDRMSALFED